jgi:hypothetical protein
MTDAGRALDRLTDVAAGRGYEGWYVPKAIQADVAVLLARVRTLEEALDSVTQRAADARRTGDYFAALCDIPAIISAALRGGE